MFIIFAAYWRKYFIGIDNIIFNSKIIINTIAFYYNHFLGCRYARF